MQRAAQVVVAVERRRQRQHGVPVVARQGGIDLRDHLRLGQRVADRRVGRVEQGAAWERFQVRRSDYLLRVHAGGRNGK